MLDRLKQLLRTGQRTISNLSDKYNPMDSDFQRATSTPAPTTANVKMPGINPSGMNFNTSVDRVNTGIEDLNKLRLPGLNQVDKLPRRDIAPVVVKEPGFIDRSINNPGNIINDIKSLASNKINELDNKYDIRETVRQFPDELKAAPAKILSREGLGSWGGVREAGKGVIRAANDAGHAYMDLMSPANYIPAIRQKNDHGYDRLNTMLQPRGTEEQQSLNTGFNFGAQMAPYGAIESATIQGLEKIPVIASKLNNPVTRFAVRRLADVLSGQVLTPEQQFGEDQLNGRLMQAGFDVVGGTAMEAGGHVVGAAGKGLRVLGENGAEVLANNKGTIAKKGFFAFPYVDKNGYETGSFSNPADRMPRVEVSDDGARLLATRDNSFNYKANGKEPEKLSELLDHKELYKRYPEFKDTKVVQRYGTLDGNQGQVASYDPKSNTITINSKNVLNDQDLKETLMHEITHNIQESEGYHTGTTPDIAKFSPDMKEKLSGISSRIREKMKVGDNEAVTRLNDEYDKTFEAAKYAAYYRNPGEIESRDVVARMNMTPEERARTSHYKSQNIPLDKWIIDKSRSKTSYSIDNPEQTVGKIDFDENEIKRTHDAHAWTSFNPEKAADSSLNSFKQSIEDEYERLSVIAEKNGTLEEFNKTFSYYQDKMKKMFMESMSRKSRTASPAVTGPAKFNYAKNDAKIDSYMKSVQERMDFDEKMTRSLERIANNEQKPIRVGDSGAMEATNSELGKLKQMQQAFKEINARSRKGETLQTILKDYSEEIQNEAKKYAGSFGTSESSPIPQYKFTNMNAKIKRLEMKTRQISRVQTLSVDDVDIPNGRVEIDKEANRIRIYHDARPDDATIDLMKRNGFRWSPYNKAWQTPVTENAVRKLKSMFPQTPPEDGIKVLTELPEDLKGKTWKKPDEPIRDAFVQEVGKYKNAEDFIAGTRGKEIEMPVESLRPSMPEVSSHRPGGDTFSHSSGPISVSPPTTTNQWVIDDGNHRYREAVARGEKTIKVKLSDGWDGSLIDYYNKHSSQPLSSSTQGKVEAPKTVRVWNKSKFSDSGAYADIPVIRKEENITLYQGGKDGDGRQFWTPDKKYASQFGEVKEKTGTFYQVDNGNRMTKVYVEAKSSPLETGEGASGLKANVPQEVAQTGRIEAPKVAKVKQLTGVSDDVARLIAKSNNADEIGGLLSKKVAPVADALSKEARADIEFKLKTVKELRDLHSEDIAFKESYGKRVPKKKRELLPFYDKKIQEYETALKATSQPSSSTQGKVEAPAVKYTDKKPLPYQVEYEYEGHTLHRNFGSEEQANKWLENRSKPQAKVQGTLGIDTPEAPKPPKVEQKDWNAINTQNRINNTADSGSMATAGDVLDKYKKFDQTKIEVKNPEAVALADKYKITTKYAEELLAKASKADVERALISAKEIPGVRNNRAYIASILKKGKVKPEIKPTEDLADVDSMYKMVDQEAEIKKPKTAKPEPVEALAKPQPAKEVIKEEPIKPAEGPISNSKPLIEQIAKPEDVTDNNAHVLETQRGTKVLRSMAEQTKTFIDENKLDHETIRKVWDGEELAPDAKYTKAVNQLKKLNQEVYSVRNSKGDVAFNDHMPRVFGQEADELDTFFSEHSNINPIMDDLMTDPHRKHFSGTGEGFITDPVEAVVTSGTRAIQNYLKPLTKGQREVIEHVGKLEDNNPIDYVDKLSDNSEPKKKIDYQLGVALPALKLKNKLNQAMTSIRQRWNIFEKIGQEAPELTEAYKRVVNGSDLSAQRNADIQKFIDNKDTKGLTDYFDELIAPEDKAKFRESVDLQIKTSGLENTAYKLNKMLYKKTASDFINIAGKYDYADARVKNIVNSFIDDTLKQGKARIDLEDKVFNTVNRVFSMAQIGGNLKVAGVQLLDTFRLPANYTIKEIKEGYKKAITETFSIEKKYGFKDSTLANKKLNKTGTPITEKVGGGVETVLYGPLQATEAFKNRVYIGAAEARGKAQGLIGNKLIEFVRSEVFKRANIAHSENTPLFLKDSAVNRSILQYSQFAIKNMIEMGDEVQAKRYGKAAALLVANTLSALTVAGITGMTAMKAIQGIFPAGVGPIITVPMQMYEQAVAKKEADEKGYDSERYSKRIKDLIVGNFIPGGAQYNKTAGQASIMRKGYEETPSGLVKYEAPKSKLENIQGLILGKSSTKTNRDYYNDPNSAALSKKQSTLYKAGAKDFATIMEERKQNKILKNLKEGKDSNGAKDLGNGLFQVGDTYYSTVLDKEFNSLKKAQQAINLDKFDKSGEKSALANGDYYYRDDNDEPKRMSNQDFQLKIATAQLEQAYDAGNYKEYVNIAKQKLNLIKTQFENADPLTKIELQNDYNDLQEKLDKYASYGGAFKKPKKAKKFDYSVSNDVAATSNTYKNLQSLLAGTRNAPSISRPTIRKPQLRKILGA